MPLVSGLSPVGDSDRRKIGDIFGVESHAVDCYIDSPRYILCTSHRKEGL